MRAQLKRIELENDTVSGDYAGWRAPTGRIGPYGAEKRERLGLRGRAERE